MDSSTRMLGLIGYPLSHSFSQRYFRDKFSREKLRGFEYVNFPLKTISRLPQLILGNENLIGLNVTIPYKESVIPYLDSISPLAQAVGAVNVIRIERDTPQPVLQGFNTDVTGINVSLDRWRLPVGIRALIFGSGGASKAVAYVLNQRGIPFRIVSRKDNPDGLKYEEITSDRLRQHRLLFNCTPVGMFPDIQGTLPIPWDGLTREHFLFDLIYNPEITTFIRQGMEHGATVQGGLGMLQGQAEASWNIWLTRDQR